MHEEDFEKKFGFKKPRRDQEIIFYCRSGVRAATAGDIAKKNRYEKSVVSPTLSRSHGPWALIRMSGCITTRVPGWNGFRRKDTR